MHFDGWMLLLLTNDYRQFGEWRFGMGNNTGRGLHYNTHSKYIEVNKLAFDPIKQLPLFESHSKFMQKVNVFFFK